MPKVPVMAIAAIAAIGLSLMGIARIVTGQGSAQARSMLKPDFPSDAPRAAQPVPGAHVEVPPPPFSDGIFPCTNCHDGRTVVANRSRRELKDMHTEIVLKHDEEHRWCLDCHDADDRDRLHLASGEPVPFDESYRLCGQCHGEKYRDWRAGVHGRRVGQWNGAKKYLLCVHCHSPHQPRFKPLEPKPSPKRPSRPAG